MSSTVETPRKPPGEDEESKIRPPATKSTSEEEEESSTTNRSENATEGLVDPRSSIKESTRLEDKTEPNVDNGKRETILSEDTDVGRSTTELWPENPIKSGGMRSDGVATKVVSDSTKEEDAAAQGKEGEIAFAQPLLIDGKVENRTTSSLIIMIMNVVIRKAQRRELLGYLPTIL